MTLEIPRQKCITCDKVFEEGSELKENHENECSGFEYVDENPLNDTTLGEISQSDHDDTIIISPTPEDIQKLRPISYFDNTMYLQVNIPVIKKILDKDGNEKDKERTHETYYVTSNRELLHISDPKFENFQMPASEINNDFERWTYSDIVSYCSDGPAVDLVEFYKSTENFFRQYMDFQKDEYYTLVTLWTIGTYVSRLFSYYPYLDLFGTKGSAKSKLLSLFEKMAFNGKMISGMTSAVVIRLVESCAYTLLMDETESLRNPKQDKENYLLQLLMVAYKMNSTIPINIQTKKGWKPQFFDAGTCISLAHINEIDNVLEDRTIPLTMEITLKKNIGNSDPEVDIKESAWKAQRAKFYEFALENANEIHDMSKERLEHDVISNRELNQIWKPIIVLAKFFQDKGVPDLNRQIDLLIRDTHDRKVASNTEENPDIQLLELLVKHLLTEKTTSRGKDDGILQKSLFETLENHEKLEWLTSDKILGSGLKRLGFTSKRSREGKTVFITDQLLAVAAKRFGLEYKELKDVDLGGIL